MAAGRHAIVVGAGLGGLATSVRLALQGYRVTVLERQPLAGGVCERFDEAGYKLDMGPTLLIMRDIVEKLFADAGETLSDHLKLRQVVPNYAVHFADGERLDFHADRERMAAEVDRLEPGAGARFMKLMDETLTSFRYGRRGVLERNFRSWMDYVTAPIPPQESLALLSRGTLDTYLGRFFKDRRLRDAFGFQTLYLGMSPYDTPALFALLACVELDEGIWFPEGGMASIAAAIQGLAERRGVTFRFGADVEAIETQGTRATGVRLASGETLDADLLVVNASVATAYQELLPDPPPWHHSRLRPSASVFVMGLGIEGKVPGIGHHNLYLPADTRKTYDELCKGHRIPEELFLYVCSPSVTQPDLAPEDGQTLYVLTMAPNLKASLDWDAEIPNLRERVFDRLETLGYGDLRPRIRVERQMSPEAYARRFRQGFGTPFGYTQHLDQVAYMRPHNRHARYGNVYFVGANTHPGGGVPLVILSAQLVAERIREEQAEPALR